MLGARSDARLVELAKKLRRDGAEVEHCVCDIGAAADSVALVDNTLARYGRLDGAFNNGGISGGVGRLADLSEERFDEPSRVNFKACGWRCAPDPALLRNPQAGAIVNTSSVGCLRGGPNLSAYPATKRAVIGLTTTAAHATGATGWGERDRFGPHGHRHDRCVEATRSGDRRATERDLAARPRRPAQRGRREGGAWLLSDRALYVFGAVLVVDGGMTA